MKIMSQSPKLSEYNIAVQSGWIFVCVMKSSAACEARYRIQFVHYPWSWCICTLVMQRTGTVEGKYSMFSSLFSHGRQIPRMHTIAHLSVTWEIWCSVIHRG